jgi:hypothetical protein
MAKWVHVRNAYIRLDAVTAVDVLIDGTSYFPQYHGPGWSFPGLTWYTTIGDAVDAIPGILDGLTDPDETDS